MERSHPIATPVLNPLQKRMLASRRSLASRGFNEAVTWSFIPEAHAKLFGGGQAELKLANAISSNSRTCGPRCFLISLRLPGATEAGLPMSLSEVATPMW
jgi:phenylalanyl-tRNA synthetase beta chain